MEEATAPNPLRALADTRLRELILDRSIGYGRLTGLPSEWLPSIFEMLAMHSEDPDLAVRVVQRALPELTQDDSEYRARLRAYRSQKVRILAARLGPDLKGPAILDFGGQTADLLDEIAKARPDEDRLYVSGINDDETAPSCSRRVLFLPSDDRRGAGLPPGGADTIILSMVMHHVSNQEEMLALLTASLKPRGRIILIEDSFPEDRGEAIVDGIMERFLSLRDDAKFQAIAFLDWLGNRITRPHPSVELPARYRTMEGWRSLLESYGLSTLRAEFIGSIECDRVDLIPPKAYLVFEKAADIVVDGIESLARIPGRRIGVFSGSFNPPHLGHLSTIRAILGRFVDSVLICPHSFNPDKQGSLADIEARVEMLRLLALEVGDGANVFVASPKFIHGLWNADAIRLLRGLEKAGREILVVTGMDTVQEGYYPGLAEFRHLIAKRERGNSEEAAAKVMRNGFILFDREHPHYSSTGIRRSMSRENVGIDSVYRYIAEHGLYGRGRSSPG